jgi:hypothetical protein
MCAACVAQGAVYAGGALAGLQVMAARARRRRGPRPVSGDGDPAANDRYAQPADDHGPSEHDPASPATLQKIHP